MPTLKNIAIRRCSHAEVAPLIAKGKKERVTFDNPSNAIWVGAFEGSNIIGSSCVVVNPKTKTARFKSFYVLSEHRGNGYFNSMFRMLLKICIKLKIRKITAFCTPMSLPQHQKHGFQVQSWKGDIAFVARELRSDS